MKDYTKRYIVKITLIILKLFILLLFNLVLNKLENKIYNAHKEENLYFKTLL